MFQLSQAFEQIRLRTCEPVSITLCPHGVKDNLGKEMQIKQFGKNTKGILGAILKRGKNTMSNKKVKYYQGGKSIDDKP